MSEKVKLVENEHDDDDVPSSPEPVGRVNNFPPCKPMFHHRLEEIPLESRRMVKLGLAGVVLVTVAYFWNCLALTATFITSGQHVFEFAISIGYVFGGPLAASTVYMCLYTAARKRSSLYYCCFFTFFCTGTVFFGILALGPPSWGSAGIITVTSTSGNHNPVADAFDGIAIGLWVLVVLYNVYVFFVVRSAYTNVGGMKAAAKEAGQVGAKAAYDNREEIKAAAVEHQDVIKEVVADNKDLLIDVMADNKDLIVEAAIDNPELAVAVVQSASSNSKQSSNSDQGLKIKWDDYD